MSQKPGQCTSGQEQVLSKPTGKRPLVAPLAHFKMREGFGLMSFGSWNQFWRRNPAGEKENLNSPTRRKTVCIINYKAPSLTIQITWNKRKMWGWQCTNPSLTLAGSSGSHSWCSVKNEWAFWNQLIVLILHYHRNLPSPVEWKACSLGNLGSHQTQYLWALLFYQHPTWKKNNFPRQLIFKSRNNPQKRHHWNNKIQCNKTNGIKAAEQSII